MKKVKNKISNKLNYTLIALFAILVFGIGVYAYGGTSPSVVGHTLGEIAPPSGCSTGQALVWSGSAWQCQTIVTGSSVSFQVGDISTQAITSVTSGNTYSVAGNCPLGTKVVSGWCHSNVPGTRVVFIGSSIHYTSERWLCSYYAISSGSASGTLSARAICVDSSLVNY